MRRFKLNRKAAAVGVVVGLALAVGGVAFAYVTATGSGTGYGKVGTVQHTHRQADGDRQSCTTPTKLLPGETQSCTYKVHNATGGQVKFTANTVALATTNTPTVTGTAGKVTGVQAGLVHRSQSPPSRCRPRWLGEPHDHRRRAPEMEHNRHTTDSVPGRQAQVHGHGARLSRQ